MSIPDQDEFNWIMGVIKNCDNGFCYFIYNMLVGDGGSWIFGGYQCWQTVKYPSGFTANNPYGLINPYCTFAWSDWWKLGAIVLSFFVIWGSSVALLLSIAIFVQIGQEIIRGVETSNNV